MNAPSAVVFDLGKVLLDFDYGISSRKIADQSDLSASEVFHLLCQSTLPYRLESGLLTTEEFYNEVRTATGFRGGLEQFTGHFADIFSEIKPMTAMQAALRARGVPTYIFSNTNDIAIRHVRERYPFFANFDGYILSYEQGVMKPDPRIYEIVERQTAHSGAALLYLDDRAENIATGAERGWRTLLHEDPEKTRVAVDKMFQPEIRN
jgi:HAD superfamily hydrolase (TIGR01509 family)